jgi:alpha-amylase
MANQQQNGTLLQCFHWYLPADGSLWKFLASESKRLADMGITALWTPPAFKGSKGNQSEGYDLYDLYDLGEFDQKGSVSTKYGSKQEYIDGIAAAHAAGLQVYVDIIINHLSGADGTEQVPVKKVDPENRNAFISDRYDIEAFTLFNFPGRNGKYSAFKWDHNCFTGVDFAKNTQEKAIFSIVNEYGDGWEEVADTEHGNYDYLMGTDIEFRNPAVREALKQWGAWYWQLAKFDGMRLDAVKHISPGYLNEWLDHMRTVAGKELFAVGEYWAPEKLKDMLRFIDITGGRMLLFDACLQHNLFEASRRGKDYDLTTLFHETLVAERPSMAVTLTGNHDTQPLQLLEAPLENWFKDAAYGLILLRADGYPCIFYPDLYGATYTDKNCNGEDCEVVLEPVKNLDKLIKARQLFAYGQQRDYLDFPTCIGWTREGDETHAGSGCAVVLSNADKGVKKMEMGKQHAGKSFRDYLGNSSGTVTIGADGWAEFYCEPGSLSVWTSY